MNSSDTSLEPYAEYGRTILHKSFVSIMCSLSMVGSGIIVASYICWKDIRTTSRKILLFLSFSDFLIACTNLAGVFLPVGDTQNEPRNWRCVTQSFITNSASITSFLWTLSLAIYLYLAIVKNKQALGRKLLPWFHVINWSLGPIINGVALYENMLGYPVEAISGGWCWIYHDSAQDTNKSFVISEEETIWIIVDAKGMEIIIYVSIFVIYMTIKYKLHVELKESKQGPMNQDVLRSAKRADRKLIFVPLLLFLGRFWGILRFVLIVLIGDWTSRTIITTKDKVFLTLQGVGDSSQGFLNCILFCFLNPRVYSHLKEALVCFICSQKQSQGSKGDSNDEAVEPLNAGGGHGLSVPPPSEEEQPLLDGVIRVDKYGSKWKKI